MVVLQATHKASQRYKDMITMTYKIAHAAGWDAGNKLMRELSLTAWNETCFIQCVEVFNKLWPDSAAISAPVTTNAKS